MARFQAQFHAILTVRKKSSLGKVPMNKKPFPLELVMHNNNTSHTGKDLPQACESPRPAAANGDERMSWLSSRLGSGLRHRSDGGGHESTRCKTEAVRSAILEILDQDGSARAESLARRVRHAADAEHLWHLRGEVMSVLASSQGEAVARDKLQNIGALFLEVLPNGLAAQLRHRGPGAAAS